MAVSPRSCTSSTTRLRRLPAARSRKALKGGSVRERVLGLRRGKKLVTERVSARGKFMTAQRCCATISQEAFLRANMARLLVRPNPVRFYLSSQCPVQRSKLTIGLSKSWLGRALWGLTVRRRALPCPCLAPAYEHLGHVRLCSKVVPARLVASLMIPVCSATFSYASGSSDIQLEPCLDRLGIGKLDWTEG